MVIGGNHHEWHLLDGGKVQPLVRRARLHPAFTNGGETDKILFAL
jgi:hypothetical protein